MIGYGERDSSRLEKMMKTEIEFADEEEKNKPGTVRLREIKERRIIVESNGSRYAKS